MAGPGTELKRIMPSLAKAYAWLQGGKSCGCEDYADLMDQWGVGGCERRRGQIVERLVGKAPSVLQELPTVQDCAASLVGRAIEAAKQSDPTRCQCGRKLKESDDGKCYWCRNKERLDAAREKPLR